MLTLGAPLAIHASPAAAAPVAYVVTSTLDPGDGTCDADCTLREAINAANAHPNGGGRDEIHFAIPEAGVHVITPVNTPLPPITNPVVIDGYTQPGSSPNTEMNGEDARIRIEIADSPADGLTIRAGDSVVRGLAIVTSFGDGIRVESSGGVEIQGNYLGWSVARHQAAGNVGDGVSLDGGDAHLVGGISPGERNVISDQSSDGVRVAAGSDGDVIQGNHIGTNPSGTVPAGNLLTGIRVLGSDALIGGAADGAGNVIWGNGSDVEDPNPGIGVGAGTGNRISGNSIYANQTLGIDLGQDGVTANDSGDGDSGANKQQNYPVLLDAARGPVHTLASGSLDSAPSKTYRLEFFDNQDCDGTGHGEGQTFLGAKNVTTDGTGQGSFSAMLAGAPVGDYVTATATDPEGNTSEFSQCVQVTQAPVLAFTSDRSGNRDVWAMTAAGLDQTNLTRSASSADYEPSLGADGRIAFTSTRDGNREIYVMNADGTGLQRITKSPAGDYGPSFGPNGVIAFTSDRKGNRDIWLYEPNTDGPAFVTRLTNDPAGDYDPAFLPGGQIAFTSTRSGNEDIWTMDANGNGLSQVTTDPASDYEPAPTPYGPIMWTSTRDGSRQIYQSAGESDSRLTDLGHAAFEPTYNSQGSLDFTSTRMGSRDIYRFDPEGPAQRLTTDPRADYEASGRVIQVT